MPRSVPSPRPDKSLQEEVRNRESGSSTGKDSNRAALVRFGGGLRSVWEILCSRPGSPLLLFPNTRGPASPHCQLSLWGTPPYSQQ